jgi:uncharacterized protein with LGFP repeats
MPPHQARFVTVCQQLLTLGVVLAVITPAANIVSLDVVQKAPITTAPTALAAYAQAATVKSVVPSGVVDPIVKEVPLTAPSGVSGRRVAGAPQARVVAGKRGGAQLTSAPQVVSGYGAVGVTWEPGKTLSEKQIQVQVRTETDAAWTEWMPVQYDADHGPDPRSDEARKARPGTDALLVGDVDEVQVKVTTTDGSAPPDLRLAVIAPGEPAATKVQAPAIDTRDVDARTTEGTPPEAPAGDPAPDPVVDPAAQPGAIDLQAGVVTPKPVIYSRAQWGADERMRDKGSLHYFEVHAGFVHHTVNANNYTRAQVPGLLRSIYAYHTRSRGWSDIGYNYLVDRFGRIWEGRAGGVDRPVVGAHTLGYNDYSFAMSAIGNYDIKQPSAALIQAYGALFAWKLSLHGVSAASAVQKVGRKNFRAINGHRDAGSTACPGKYLYAKIPQIRTLAASAQRGWTGRELRSHLASTRHPDLIVRNASDKFAYILPIRGRGPYRLGKAIPTGVNLATANLVLNAGDWNGDGKGDFIYRTTAGVVYVRLGNGKGQFPAQRVLATGFKNVQLLAAVGDVTGDGWPDLMGQPAGSSMRIYPGRGATTLAPGYAAAGRISAARQVAVGRMDADGAPDVMFASGTKVTLSRGNGPGGITSSRAFALNLAPYDWAVGISDVAVNPSGHSDLVVRNRRTTGVYLIPLTSTSYGAPQLLSSSTKGYDLAG